MKKLVDTVVKFLRRNVILPIINLTNPTILKIIKKINLDTLCIPTHVLTHLIYDSMKQTYKTIPSIIFDELLIDTFEYCMLHGFNNKHNIDLMEDKTKELSISQWYTKEAYSQYNQAIALFRSTMIEKTLALIDARYKEESVQCIKKLLKDDSITKEDLRGAKVVIIQEDRKRYVDLINTIVDDLLCNIQDSKCISMALTPLLNLIISVFNNFSTTIIEKMLSMLYIEYSSQVLLLFLSDRIMMLNQPSVVCNIDKHIDHKCNQKISNDSHLVAYYIYIDRSIKYNQQVTYSSAALLGYNALKHLFESTRFDYKNLSIRCDAVQLIGYTMIDILIQTTIVDASDESNYISDMKVYNYYNSEIPCYFNSDPMELCAAINYYYNASLTYKIVLEDASELW